MRVWQWLIGLLIGWSITPIHSARAAELMQDVRLQVSIITCGPGQDLYSVYGHSAVRIIDSTRGTDKVYNYGTFDFSDPEFYWKFTRGKLLYYLSLESYEGFVQNYDREGRSMYEQVLNLNQSDALAIQNFLETNALPENKYYRYDFLFDNCSTRIRDIFPKLMGERFSYGVAMSDDSLSFRELLDVYERNIHWERFGINLLLSSTVDRRMKGYESMFLPDYLQKGFHGAQLDGRPLVKQTLQVLPSRVPFSTESNAPRRMGWILLFALILASISPVTRRFMVFFDVFWFLALGLLGVFMIFMWLGTEHTVCAFNLNLFWAVPTHIILAYWIGRDHSLKMAYARIAINMLLVGVLLSWFGPQPYAPELTPYLLLLYWRLSVHGSRFNLKSFRTWPSKPF